MDTSSFLRPHQQDGVRDKIETFFKQVSEHILIVVFGFLPLIIVPVAFLPTDYQKIIFVIVAIALSAIFYGLSTLRTGAVSIAAPLALIVLWLVAIVGSLSALFSGDASDAFVGDLFEVNTAVFLILLALVASLTSVFKFSKMSIMRLYIFLTGSAAILGLFHVSRLLFGAEFLSLGVFNRLVSSPVGSWNDLGLFFGLSILLSMVALEQLPLTKWGRGVFTFGIVLSLIVLGVINFVAVWFVLGLVSLVLLIYALMRGRFGQILAMEGGTTSSLASVMVALLVFAVSFVFFIAGGVLGDKISQTTNVSYLEVRPSLIATVDIARAVYTENAFFGIGPNKFIDAWRLYKDPAINQTVFWNTDFRGGNGYITTFLVTSGIFGTVAWLSFLGLFLYTGFRMLFRSTHADRFWYFIGSSSFAAAAYLWGMSVIYLPGATILILAALFSAITFAAYGEIVGVRSFTLSVQNNKRAAIVLVGFVIVLIVGSASTLYLTSRHVLAVYTYSETITNATPGTTLQQVEEGIARAFALNQNDLYARQVADYQLGKINALMQITEPTPEQLEEFQKAVVNGINSAQRAVELDSTDAQNWSTLGAIYSVLVAAGETEVVDRATEAIGFARTYAPQNPRYILQEAQLNARMQDLERARELINEAIALKPNFAEGLSFLAELEVSTGRTEEAIAATRSITNLEPNNPARFYQLAVLLSTVNDVNGAIAALERAVALNTNYANARYLLALAYAQEGRNEEAVAQLEVVATLNPDNQNVSDLVNQIQSGQYQAASSSPTESVTEPASVVEDEATVTASEAPDTPLIKPVNAVSDSAAEQPDSANEAPETNDELQVNEGETDSTTTPETATE